MKCLFVCLSVLILISCNQPINNTPEKGSTVAEKIDYCLENEPIIDTIFLDYRFGMTEREFNKHTDKLLESGRVYNDENTGYITYDISAHKNELIKCTFVPEYYDGKLSKLSIQAKPIYYTSSGYEIDYPNKNVLAYLTLVSTYLIKYRNCDIEKKVENIKDGEESVWVRGNLLLTIITGYDDARIFYEDTRIEKQKEIDANIKYEEEKQQRGNVYDNI